MPTAVPSRGLNDAVHESIAPSLSCLESTWQLEAGEAFDVHYVAPDTCTDVVVAIDAGGRAQAIVDLPGCSFSVVRPAPGFSYVGARVRPECGGALRAAFARGALPLNLGPLASAGEARVKLADRLGELFAPGRRAAPDWVEEATRFARDFSGHRGRVSVVARQLGVSARTFQRGFLAATGLAPKAFLRVTRVRAAARRIADGEDAVSAAFALGFADQAHMIRELGQMLGFSPRQITRAPPVAEFFKTLRP